ncbi:MAG: DUF302 domain-containing protein [Acidobacteriota bacterium]
MNSFLRRRTGARLGRKTILIEVCHPTTLLEGLLTDNPIPLLLPLRIVVHETDDNACVMHLPEWDVGKEADGVTVHHCMDLLYTETVFAIARTIQDLLGMERENSSIQPIGRAAWDSVADERSIEGCCIEGRFRRREL